MNLKILLPSEVFAEKTGVSRVVAETPQGSFGLVGVMRRWSTLLEELGMPPLLRSDWIPPDASGH